MHLNEEMTFWVLNQIMTKYEMVLFFRPGLPRLKYTLKVFDELIVKFVPKAAAHFEKEGIVSSMFATDWFHTLFSTNFSLKIVFHVWDCFLTEGYSIILRIAVSLIKENKDEIIGLQNEALFKVLRSLPEKITDSTVLINSALKIPKITIMKEPKTWDFTEEDPGSSFAHV